MAEKGADQEDEKLTLKDSIYSHMPLIDMRLAAEDSLLAVRPFVAAAMFVKDCILEVSNDPDKDDFAAKPWFAIVYHHVKAWYCETYADAMNRGAGGVACGMVLVRDLPVELAVPLTRSKVETPGESAWLFFPVTVEPDEDPLDWLERAPNLATLDKADKEEIGREAVVIATSLRSIRINFMGIEPHDDTVFGLLEGVLPEFESAARQVLRAEATGRASALWALQMAVERTLKAFARHKAGTFRQIHNLYELFDDIAGYATGVDRNLLNKLPRDRDVMSDRYGLRGTPTIWETFEAYKAALSLVSSVSRHFKRKVSFGGGGVLLRKPPWTTLPSDQAKEEFGKDTAGEPPGQSA